MFKISKVKQQQHKIEILLVLRPLKTTYATKLSLLENSIQESKYRHIKVKINNQDKIIERVKFTVLWAYLQATIQVKFRTNFNRLCYLLLMKECFKASAAVIRLCGFNSKSFSSKS